MLWFVEHDGNKIGRIPANATPQNPQITEFVIPTANSTPHWIALGPDNALWFTEGGGNKIGRIPANATNANQITEFTIPTAASGPRQITAGPDGALWFTEQNTGKIGRIPTNATPQNPQITEFPVPADVGTLDSITAGPDISVWFGGLSKVGRIATTADHKITTYAPLTSNPGISGITPGGPTPSLWYTEQVANKIGRQSLATNFLGDLNDDKVVNGVDLAIFAQRFGRPVGCWTVGDLNGDCVVGAVDLAIFGQNFGKSTP